MTSPSVGRLVTFAAFTASCFTATPVLAQTVGEQLSTLLTQQAPVPAGFTTDQAAAEATFATVASLLQVELNTLPATNSAGGFVYRLNPTLGAVERATSSFGPFYTERALRSGAGQVAMGFSFQNSSFGTLQGADLDTGTFPTNASRYAGALNPVSVDTLNLKLDARSVTAFAHYGVTDSLDVGVQVPVVSLRFSGTRLNTFNGQRAFSVSGLGSASGLGDMSLTARYRLPAADRLDLAVGTDVKLPTGREEDLLGAGKASIKGLVIASWDAGRFGLHGNGTIGGGGVSNEVSAGGAVTFAAAPRVTIVGELMARHFGSLNRLADVYQPHAVLAGVETMRWLPVESGVTNAYSVFGVKWNPAGAIVVNASVLSRLTDAGLRARFTPSISLDYAFER